MNPVKLFGGPRDLETTAVALKAAWGADPVHPSREIYQRIVEEMVAELVKTREAYGTEDRRGRKRERSPSRESEQSRKATYGGVAGYGSGTGKSGWRGSVGAYKPLMRGRNRGGFDRGMFSETSSRGGEFGRFGRFRGHRDGPRRSHW